MWSKIMRFLLTIFFIVLVALLVRDDTRNFLKARLFDNGTFSKISELNVSLSEIKNDVRSIVEQMPEPLVAPLRQKEGALRSELVRIETNEQRKLNGLPALVANTQLSLAAENKVDDMFKYQYFEHDSPQGKTPSDFVKGAGYEYLTIGENLALGVFSDEKDLVQAWMDSPGHRANILNSHFTEVGIAAKKGFYKGDSVWLAVQEFGRPPSLCPKPDETEKSKIEKDSSYITEFAKNLSTLRAKIESTSENNQSYNDLVASYNKLVKEYNTLTNALREISETYNKDVKAFNDCVKGNT